MNLTFRMLQHTSSEVTVTYKIKTTFDGRKGAGDDVLELPIGILQDDTGQVTDYERT